MAGGLPLRDADEIMRNEGTSVENRSAYAAPCFGGFGYHARGGRQGAGGDIEAVLRVENDAPDLRREAIFDVVPNRFATDLEPPLVAAAEAAGPAAGEDSAQDGVLPKTQSAFALSVVRELTPLKLDRRARPARARA